MMTALMTSHSLKLAFLVAASLGTRKRLQQILVQVAAVVQPVVRPSFKAAQRPVAACISCCYLPLHALCAVQGSYLALHLVPRQLLVHHCSGVDHDPRLL